MSRVDIHVGIDVAKDRLDVAQRPGAEAWWVTNDERGIADLVARLRALRPTLVVLEATGGIELHVVGALAAARLAVVVVNPRQTREFAKATGRLAKTDAIDAQVLAQFAEAVRPALRPLPDAATQQLSSVVTRRRQVIEMLTARRTVSALQPQRYVTISRSISAGWRAASPTWTASWSRPSTPARSGELRTTSSKAPQESARYSPPRSWPSCRNWEL